MSKIFAIGTGPLYQKGARTFSGQALRTCHFIEPLQEAGHDIDLYLHPISDKDYQQGDDPLDEPQQLGPITYHMLKTNSEKLVLPLLRQRLEDFQPDALLGINPFPSHLACRLKSDKPVWCDLNGWAMVEAQTRARVYRDDSCLPHFWRHEKSLLRRGDKFSAVSTPLKHALMGELAIMGRLNKYTFDYDFACVIPEAVARHYVELSEAGRRQDDDRFRIFWCGSFNTWTDTDLLFETMIKAMEKVPDLYFISTGGAIPGHNEKTYKRFERRVKKSPHAARFSLMGWVEPWVVDAMLMECDLGINIDSKNYDTVFGARNRITTMIGCGMPVLTTVGTEISHDLLDRELGLFAELNDAEALLDAIIYAAENREKIKELGIKSREFALEAYSVQSTVTKLLQWADHPTLAPDNEMRLMQKGEAPTPLYQIPLNLVERPHALMEQFNLEALLDSQRDLNIIRRKLLYKIGRALRLIRA